MMNFKWLYRIPKQERIRLNGYLDDVISRCEEVLGYGLLAMGYKTPIYFVTEDEINSLGKELETEVENEKRLLGDLIHIPNLNLDRKTFEEISFEERGREERYPEERNEENNTPPRLGAAANHQSANNPLANQAPAQANLLEPDNYKNPLGLYCHNGPMEEAGPEIFISYDKIKRVYPKKAERLTLLVLAHELGHAIMDAERGGVKILNEWIEEPLANLIALEYLEAAGPSRTGRNGLEGNTRLDDAMAFVAGQTTHYKLGLDMFLAKQQGYNFDWRRWRMAKWSTSLQTQIDNINRWINYVSSCINNLNIAQLHASYNSITTPPFEKKYNYNSFVKLYTGSNFALQEKATFIATRYLQHDQHLNNGNGLIVVVAKDVTDSSDYKKQLTTLLGQDKVLLSNSIQNISQNFAIPYRSTEPPSDSRILVTREVDEKIIWAKGVCAIYFDRDPSTP